MQKVFTSNKIEKAKCQNALRIKGLWHFFTSNILLQKTRFTKCQKHFWTEKSEIFARKLKKQNKTGYKKPLKTLGFSRVKWRRKRDSNPRGFWPNGFQDRLVVTASIFLHITATLWAALYAENIYEALKNSFFRIRFAYPTKSSGSLLTSDKCGYSRYGRDIPLQPFRIVIYY